MSYSRHYSRDVYYSGSVRYPASQNGGTVNYSGSVPVNVTIYVDTDPFDSSVNNCNTAVNGLTTAVVATEAAQVESKRKASRKIAETIIKGFFDFVGADLAQKIKEIASKCESLFAALLGHRDACLNKREQMQDDYNRITRQYSKVFQDLDKEVVSRIQLLDKPTFQFAQTAQELLDRNCNTNLLGIATISANESIALEAVLSCSHVKKQTRKLLNRANNYLQGSYRLANSVRDMLSDSPSDAELLLPVMFVESVVDSENKETKLFGTNAEYAPSGQGIDAKLRSQFLSKELSWGEMENKDLENVISYLNTELQSSEIDDRTLRTMLGLLNSQEIQTIKI